MEDSYFQSDEFKDLLTSYERDLKAGRSIYMDAEDFADIADHYINADRCDLALEAVEKGLLIHPGEEVLWVVKSAAYIYQHEFDKAEKIIQKLDPSNPDVQYQKAQLRYAKYEDIEGAEKIWREWMAQENEENPSESQKREAYLHIISSLVELCENELGTYFDDELVERWVREYIEKFQPLGRYDEDIQLADICHENDLAALMSEILSQVLEERPYLPHGWSHLALAQFVAKRYEQALESCAFALAIDDNDVETLLTKAHTLHAMKEHVEAKKVFKEYLDKGGEPIQIIPYAELLFENGENEKALAQLQKLRIHVLERMHQVTDDLEAAKKEYVDDRVSMETAFLCYQDSMNGYEQVLTDMCELYRRNEYYAEGIEVCQMLLKENPKSSNAYFMLGVNQLSQSKLKDATQNFSTAMKCAIDPIMTGIDVALSFVFEDYDRFALEVLNMVSELAKENDSPSVKRIPAAKAITYLKLGDTKLFLQNFKIACKTSPRLLTDLFGRCFPEGLPIDQWYDYAKGNVDTILNKLQNDDSDVE